MEITSNIQSHDESLWQQELKRISKKSIAQTGVSEMLTLSTPRETNGEEFQWDRFS